MANEGETNSLVAPWSIGEVIERFAEASFVDLGLAKPLMAELFAHQLPDQDIPHAEKKQHIIAELETLAKAIPEHFARGKEIFAVPGSTATAAIVFVECDNEVSWLQPISINSPPCILHWNKGAGSARFAYHLSRLDIAEVKHT